MRRLLRVPGIDQVGEARGGIRVGDAAGCLRGVRQHVGVAQQQRELFRQRCRREIALRDGGRAAGGNQGARIGALVVVDRVRQRNEQRRAAGHRELGDR